MRFFKRLFRFLFGSTPNVKVVIIENDMDDDEVVEKIKRDSEKAGRTPRVISLSELLSEHPEILENDEDDEEARKEDA